MLFDDLGQVGRYSARSGQKLVRIAADDLGDFSHLVLGRRRELVPLYLRQIGRTHPNHLSHFAQADLLLPTFPAHELTELLTPAGHHSPPFSVNYTGSNVGCQPLVCNPRKRPYLVKVM